MSHEPSQPVIVICALESEAIHLRSQLVDSTESPFHHWRRTCGTIGDAPVEIIVCGIGMVDAASAATAASLEREPRAILNYGCSGAHREDVRCGDVIVGERVVNLGSFIVESDGNRRPMHFRPSRGDGAPREDLVTVPADPSLLQLARDAASEVDLPRWPGLQDAPAVHFGTVGSADVWTQHAESIRRLNATYQTLCEDMEAAAMAQVCERFDVPFLTIKDISNNELHDLTDLLATGPVLSHANDQLGMRAALIIEALIPAIDQ